jgi:hypothetical protein
MLTAMGLAFLGSLPAVDLHHDRDPRRIPGRVPDNLVTGRLPDIGKKVPGPSCSCGTGGKRTGAMEVWT